MQIEAKLGDLAYNIAHTETLIDEAARSGAEVVGAPEFFTTPIVFSELLFRCSLPAENPALEMLRRAARRWQIVVGGSYLEHRGDDVFNCYVVVEPGGTVHRHDKDLPTMVENAFYRGGRDAGLVRSSLCDVGSAMCWEMIRTQTVHRLRGKVDLLMTGSHWWSDRMLAGHDNPILAAHSASMARVPCRLAQLVGAPLLHAGHAGVLEGRYLLVPGARLTAAVRTELLGNTMIVAADGEVLALRSGRDGAGIVSAEIVLGRVAPTLPVPERFWLPRRMPWRLRWTWWHQNACGRALYRAAKRRRQLRPASLPACTA